MKITKLGSAIPIFNFAKLFGQPQQTIPFGVGENTTKFMLRERDPGGTFPQRYKKRRLIVKNRKKYQ